MTSRPRHRAARSLPWSAAVRRRLRGWLVEHWPALALRLLRPEGAELGRCGEALAARALRAAGWTVEARNVPAPEGELDLLVSHAGRSVVVEVKTGRVADLDGPAQDPRAAPGRSLDPEQLERLLRAARRLARRAGDAPRVDLLEVRVDATSGRTRLRHHPDLRGPEDLPWAGPCP